MQWVKKAINFYINSSIHVALSACALVLVTFFRFDIPIEFPLVAMVFFSTITGYNFVKYAGIAKLHHRSLTKNLRLIQIFSLLCFLSLLFLIPQQSKAVLWVLTGLGIMTFFYAVPFLPKHKNLRDLRTAKIFVIALVWAGTAAILPLAGKLDFFSEKIIGVFFQYLFFVIALTIPFEIRDLQYDHSELGTFPQRIGVANTKYFGYALLVLVVAIQLIIEGVNYDLIPLGVTSVVTAFFIRFAALQQSFYYTAFFGEIIPFLWLLGYIFRESVLEFLAFL